MDDEDARRLLDIIGDVQALNDYLHGANNKSIDEDDVTNAAFGSAGSFYSSSSEDPGSALKDGGNSLGEVGVAGGAGLQLPSSLDFIQEELGRASPAGMDLGEEQPFDILQKSLQEADITEQTLAQEALLESPPSSVPFPQQLVSGGFGGVLGAGPFAGAQPQSILQQVPQQALHNGTAGHIQVLGAFGAPSSVMAINSLERPQILLQPEGGAVSGLAGGVVLQRQAGLAGGGGQGGMFAPTTGCGGPIPLQNIIIQRGPPPQTLIRHIQPKPLQVGGQTVYNISSLGLQHPSNAPPSGSQQATQQMKVINHSGNIVIQSPLGQQPQQQQPPGQFLLPASLSLTPASATAPAPAAHSLQALNGQALQTQPAQLLHAPSDQPSASTTYSILTNHSSPMQLVAGQNFSTSGQLIVNQGVVGGQLGQSSPMLAQGSQAPVGAAKTWASLPNSVPSGLAPTSIQSTPAHNRFTLVNSVGSAQMGLAAQTVGGGVQGLQVQQPVSVSLGQRVLVPVTQDSASSVHTGASEPQTSAHRFPGGQDSSSAVPKLQEEMRPTQFVNLLGAKALKTVTALKQVESPSTPNTQQLSSQKRPAPQQLTKGGLVLQQLRQDQIGVLTADRSPFTSLDDAVHRLLPYHVFQGALPTKDDFRKVDEEFEAVATHVLKRTQAMLNKYRRLLLVEAERTNPSSEMVMIDRTFNQDERSNLTQDKRLALVDPEGFIEDFCCLAKPAGASSDGLREQPNPVGGPPELSGTSPSFSRTEHHHGELTNSGRAQEGRKGRDLADSALRTESQPSCKDLGREGCPPEVSLSEHLETAINSILHLKKPQRGSYSSPAPSMALSSAHSTRHHAPPPRQSLERPLPSELGQAADTDSVLEAAVNSILEC